MKNLILSASAFCLLVAVAPVAANAADVSADINAGAAVTTPAPASLDAAPAAVPAAEPVMAAPATTETNAGSTPQTPVTDVTATSAVGTSAEANATTEATPAASAEEAPKAVKKHVKRTKAHHKSKRTAAEIAADNEATARASGAAIAKVGQGVAGVGAAGVDVNAGVHADVSPAAH